MKIKKMNLMYLRNEEHFQFMCDLRGLLVSAGEAVKTGLGAAIGQFAALCEREDVALEQIRKSGLTDPLAELDNLRDSYFRGMVLTIEAHSHHPEPEKVEMARRLQLILDHYGNFTKKSYNEETAIIHNLLQDLSARTSDEMRQLGVEPFVQAMSAANQQFETLMGQRYDEQAASPAENLRNLRKEVDALYRQLVATVDALVIVHGAAGYTDFITKLNARVDYYKNTIVLRKGKNKEKTNPQPSDEA